jgi:hypothetical protein
VGTIEFEIFFELELDGKRKEEKIRADMNIENNNAGNLYGVLGG